jgi:hypothetical protein
LKPPIFPVTSRRTNPNYAGLFLTIFRTGNRNNYRVPTL